MTSVEEETPSHSTLEYVMLIEWNPIIAQISDNKETLSLISQQKSKQTEPRMLRINKWLEMSFVY